MKKFFKGCLISILCSVIILVVGVVVVMNLTPRQLKLADISLAGMTIEDMGIADIKIWNIFKSISSIGNANEQEIVKRPYVPETEKTNAQNNLDNSSLDGESYSEIAKNKVVYPDRYLLTYQDTTLAYLMNSAIYDAENTSEATQALKDTSISICEITITTKDNKGSIRIVSKMALDSLDDAMGESMGSVGSMMTVPEKIFIVSELDFTVNSEGKMETESKSLSLNGNTDDPVTNAITNMLLGNSEEGNTLDGLNQSIGTVLSQIIYNLGAIGTAEVVEGNLITGDFNLGFGGVKENALTVVTHIEE